MDAHLERLSSACGIEPGYHDVWGEWRTTSEATHRGLLASMGIDAADPAKALAEMQRVRWTTVVPQVTVLRAGRLAEGVRIHLAEGSLRRSLAWRIALEDGDVREGRFDPQSLASLEGFRRDGFQAWAFKLELPTDLPHGYHRLSMLEDRAVLGEGLLVVAPERCYLPDPIAEGGRVWGTALQLYGLRSANNAGIGDFTDLRHCVEIWGERGAGIVGTNPLHALPLRDPGHGSPYSPSSRLFLNVLYIDVEAVEDFGELAAADEKLVTRWREECARLRAAPEVDYTRVAAAKRAMFEALYAHFARVHLVPATRRARDFARFRDRRGEALRRHALHEALAEFHALPWREWPAEHRDPSSPAVKRFAAEHAQRVTLHEYLQWQADLQLGAAQDRCRELGMTVGLYADLAISIAADGSESWANQSLYALGVSVGAPPDEFNRDGQDWGLPPLSPERLRDARYEPLIATLRANMARAGALRIDHAMGLSRLYWVPAGTSAAEGAYVRYRLDDLLGIVALESHRHRCIVIGEDLGTVSDDLRRKLDEAGILSYRLLLFERDGRAFKPPSSYPRRALVAWSTHDLPTLAGWWRSEDLRTREALGLLGGEELRREIEERGAARQALVEALAREGLDTGEEELAQSVHAFLAKTPAAVLVVQMEDVLGVAEQANLPGTVEEHPNWRRKLPVPLEQWARDARFKRLTRMLASVRGRARSKREAPPGMENARIPRATYRVQLNNHFTFRDLTRLVPYLASLGVSHVYCSPYLRARPGSQHGYDIIDHESLNPEIGTREDFNALVDELRRHGMAQVMDVVPNHMGVHGEDNLWWQDVLENGPASTLADFFDIDWHPPSEHLANRLLLPILGDHYGVELAAGKIVLGFEPATGAFAARYFGNRLPIDPHEYPRILGRAVRDLESAGASVGHHAQLLRSIMEAFGRLPARDATDRALIDERNLAKEVTKGRLASLVRTNREVAGVIARALEAINGRAGDATSFEALHELLEAQAYRVAHWRVAQDEINYRRFFDINDLAALRQENPAVFEATHRLVVALARSGAVEALRIDHPDGLFDPKEYFRRLQEACGRPVYVVVEKIVAPFESVPEDWAVHGTTGYRFANVVNGLFVDPAAEARMTRTYHNFVRDQTGFEETARRARRMILRTALASELTVITSQLARISRADPSTRDFTFTTLRDGLAEVISAFPVYRTSIDEEVRADDRRYVDWAVARARAESRAADVSVFDFIRDALCGELPARSPSLASAVRHFARKVQQVTAPVMAKGVEDTALYTYNRLVSLNDVGGDPSEFGFPPARFHQASAHRAKRWPHTMLATSTHDNKRSEDTRARIDVLSEMAAIWRLRINKWNRMNEGRKAMVENEPAPSRNDEYLLYQILIGTFPPGPVRGVALRQYRDRIVAYMHKATREAKVRTSWARVNEPYEAATEAFVHALLDDAHANPFLEDLRALSGPVMWIGFLNSLSMVTVKLTSPGVPDIYQGNELWDFSLVDPDNRRPVDYERRRTLLAQIDALVEPLDAALDSMFSTLEDGRAKLYVIRRLLRLRAEREALFLRGGYSPLRSSGERARHVLAFARRHEQSCVITVVPRLIAGLGVRADGPRLPCGRAVWGDTRIDLPFLDGAVVLRNVLTGTELRLADGGIDVAQILDRAPVGVLVI